MVASVKYTGQTDYMLSVAGLERKLPLVEIDKGKVYIASFVMMGDPLLTRSCARHLIEKTVSGTSIGFDYLVLPEAKAIPLAETMCQLLWDAGHTPGYIVLRKSVKTYMQRPIIDYVESITTAGRQTMVLNEPDHQKLVGKRVILLDDVVSTGGTFRCMKRIIEKSGAQIAGLAAVLREGEFDLSDIIWPGVSMEYLQELPVFLV